MCALLIEDEELIRGLLTDVMTDAGFEVIGAADAKNALGLAEAVLLPQIIISDANLGPGMDGFALAAAARWLRQPGYVRRTAERRSSSRPTRNPDNKRIGDALGGLRIQNGTAMTDGIMQMVWMKARLRGRA